MEEMEEHEKFGRSHIYEYENPICHPDLDNKLECVSDGFRANSQTNDICAFYAILKSPETCSHDQNQEPEVTPGFFVSRKALRSPRKAKTQAPLARIARTTKIKPASS